VWPGSIPAPWAKTGNCQIGVSVQVATGTASVAADWRLFCPASWDDTTLSDPERAAAVRGKRDRAGIRPPKAAYPDPPATFKTLALAAGQATARQVTWRTGSRRTTSNPAAAMRSRFCACGSAPPTATSPAPARAPCPSAG
jgi:hypothetical protein